MWIVVSIFNPLMSLLSLGLLPLADIQEVPPDLLARMGEVAMGRELGLLVSLDAVLLGLLGNIILDPINVEIFQTYFLVTAAFVALMFLRREILKVALYVSRAFVEKLGSASTKIHKNIMGEINRISESGVVYFTRGDNMVTLNRAVLYVLANEQTSNLKVVHIYENEPDIPPTLGDNLRTIDHLYPQLRIDFVAVRGSFTPETIEAISRRFKIPKNYMFIGTPGDHFPHRIEELGGVRLVL